ncbi:hypothetical protein LIER_39978 [Lithospermum erythrorhizon]|uniref:Ribosomal protein L2 n=1 Tax=Lithospermum erythrorhizon TaxID=34254 RepID=A0AAV3QS03_LITER
MRLLNVMPSMDIPIGGEILLAKGRFLVVFGLGRSSVVQRVPLELVGQQARFRMQQTAPFWPVLVVQVRGSKRPSKLRVAAPQRLRMGRGSRPFYRINGTKS